MGAIGIAITLVVGFGTVVVTAVTFWLIWAKVIGPMMKRQQEQARLLTSGQRAQARVLQLAEIGTYVNNRPQVAIVLDVLLPTGQRYQATQTTILSMLASPRVQPGTAVTVRYDPTNPALVAIEGI